MARRAAAKKSGADRIPDRSAAPSAPTPTSARADSSDAASGPPRLNLAGNKPSWRERQAQKAAEGGASNNPQAATAAPSPDMATADAQTAKKTTGYVPPARRGETAARGRPDAQPPSGARDESSGGEAAARWRQSVRRDESGRDGSPADRPSSRFAELRRGTSGREQSPADGAKQEGASDGIAAKPAPGKYVPMHLRNKQ